MHDVLTMLALGALSIAAVGWDLATRRIPNVLTASGLLVALALRAFDGPGSVAAGLLAAALAFGLAVPLVLAGGLGGGDMKLLAATAAFVGPSGLPILLLVTAIVGGMLALGVALRRGMLRETLTHSRALVARAVPTRGAQPRPRRTLRTPGALAVPYGVAIAAGAMVGWWA
jgi:prepilin peptidase CpaA